MQMGFGQIMISIVILLLSLGAFLISYLQFKEKGYLFHNAYIWASQEQRKQMDENQNVKKPYYRQSGFIFLLIGFIFMADAAYIATDWAWVSVASWVFVVITVVYAVVSSIQKERQV